MGFIFESEISTIMNTVRARTIGEEDGVKLKAILAADVHPAIKAYFRAEVEKLLQQEREKEVRSGRFPYGLPEVKGLQRQIDLLLIHHYEFDRREFESILDESVHFQFNYLCRPRWTLQEFLFESRRSAPVSVVLRKLKYCVEYRYLVEIFKRYVSDRGLAEIGYEEFRLVIERIDHEVVGTHNAGELARLLRPLVEFIDMGIPETRVSETGPLLPVNAAIVFFEDKKIEDIRKRLEVERDQNGIREVSLTDLARIIRQVRGEPEPSAEEIPDHANLRPVEVQHEPVVQAEEQADPFKGVKKGIGPSAERPADKVVQSASVADLYELFSLKEQKLFVRKLFMKDEVEFRKALDGLNPLATWEEASLALDRLYSSRNVDPFSKVAVLFTEKIFSRYSDPGKAKKAI
ncbi:MAG: hypothetical protein HBSIN02_19000 [Bacteroidia bacterium]|nr:MAG: hypothetical protein HBSIN02_19000 [Bacteroidia bacterium]